MIRYRGITIDRSTRTITHRGRAHTFQESKRGRGESVVFKSLVYLILGGAVSREQLFWHIYGNDPEGGPIDGYHIFDIHFQRWEKEQRYFSKLDLELRAQKISGVMFYELVPTYQLGTAYAAE
jgi:hypothetical protein